MHVPPEKTKIHAGQYLQFYICLEKPHKHWLLFQTKSRWLSGRDVKRPKQGKDEGKTRERRGKDEGKTRENLILENQQTNDSTIDIEKIMNHWIETSCDDFKTMNELFKSKSYNWALFVGHISVEKLLKALYVKSHRKHALFIHNLYRLAELCEIELADEYSDWLDTITSFNINARYDDYRKEFYNLCTLEYTELWISRIKELREWIKTML